MTQRRSSMLGAVLILALLLLAGASAQPAAARPAGPQNYRNPLPVYAGNTLVESCADPSVIRGATPGDTAWYMYCTTDPLSGDDRDAAGNLIFHLVPTFTSSDLINWSYVGDAFTERPSYAAPTAGIWAPEISYFAGTYYLFYGVTDVDDATSGEPSCGGDNAIGVATSASPTGPWTHADAPLIDPRRAGAGCNFFWTFDPDVIQVGASHVIYYGSYYGGIEARALDLAALTAAGPATQVTIANRYEGAEVVFHEGFYYLFVSATDCCRGAATGYSVFVGRSESPLGPFVDREGNSLLAGRVGGTPVISMNGNRWVGPGHNTVITDLAGQDWTFYHAIDRHDPYFMGEVGFTKRPVLLDPLDWIDGWPTVRAGNWASDTPQPAPAAQEGDRSRYKPRPPREDRLGQLLERYSEEFDDAQLGPAWSWVRQPAGGYGFAGGAFSFDIQPADLFVDSDTASVLTGRLPGGNYVVETKLRLPLPAEGCCWNYSQAGLVIYGDDDNYIKLTHASIWETRQTEFAREVDTPELNGPLPANPPAHQWRYGNTVVGPPGEVTYLRIVRRMQGGEEQYTAYTSQDGVHWIRGGTWTHRLGNDARIGLVAMGGGADGHAFDFTAEFDYVRVYRLR